ncbi:paraplegin isoform X2 [Phymastichus coffea]|uniref:paraplegin isoform X2 n=1 Tax=Phymastichus coffea TaxID=108790 RepID=UPI00273B4BDD|nr:paraplegin isoform X2 [Phymastichus coffea]
MQNAFVNSSRNMFRTKTNQLNCLQRRILRNDEIFERCINQNQLHRLIGSLPHNTLRQIKKECKAVQSMFLRSGINTSNLPKIYHRFLSTTSTRFNQNVNPNDPNQDKDKKKQDREKLKTYVIKLSVLTMVTYMIMIYLLGLYFGQAFNRENSDSISRFVGWNEFVYQMLAKGEVKELIVRPDLDTVTIILHDGAVVKGRKSVHRVYQMKLPNITKLEEKVREAETSLGIKPEMGIPIIYERSDATLLQLLLTTMLVLGFFTLIYRASGFKGMTTNMFSQMTRAKFTLVDPLTGIGKGVRFSDVAGLHEAKTEVMEFVDYLKNPDRYKTLGAKVPRGCGKTLLAKAVATEANVPFLSMNGSEFIEMIGGLGAARVRDLFKEGKKRAPSIIYIDEIDAIGKKRSESSSATNTNSEGEQTLNQLLTEMDGMVSNHEVIVLASTNRAEVLDKALLRPGRFDRHILIDLPNLIERKQIFETHLKGIVLEQKPPFYSHRLAYLTPGFSGADIANVCNEAALHAARVKKKKIDGTDLLYAVDRVIAGIEKRDNTITPSEKLVVAYHEAGHALVGWLLEHTDALLKVTIVPRTNRALGFSQFTVSDQKLYTKEQLFERMCMTLGGRVAESITFNKITTGAQNDLEKITKIAYAQVQQYGMDEVVGPLSFQPEQIDTTTRKPYSKKLASLMDQEARIIIAKVYKKTEQLLLENQDKLKLIAEALLKKETLTYEEVEQLIGPPPFGKKKLIEPADFENSTPIPESPELGTPPPQPAPT